MSRKEDFSEDLEKLLENSKVVSVDLNEQMRTNFIAYAMAVNVSRAIPDVRDGLKPVHRRIIYSMGEAGTTYDKPFKKSARTVGDVMGKYHPHGDSSIYDAMVRLAQDFSINCPLVAGHGNFGSIDGDGAAAARYTEAKLSKISNEMLRDIDKDTVDFVPNYDGALKEPVVLPSRFPNCLVNGSDGIAVGMATYIPPHNLKEVIAGCVAMIDNPDIDIDGLMQYIPAPDYPTRGLIMGGEAIKNAYMTGRGGVILRGRAEIEEKDDGRSVITITELPYQVNKAKLVTDIANLVKDKRVEGISKLVDLSNRNGIKIVIDIKRDFNPQVILNSLYKHTELQISNGIIMLALVNGEPKILNLKQMLYHYLEFQKEIVTRRTKYDLEKAKEKAHILEGLSIALANIDEVVQTIKNSSDRQDALQKLTQKFMLDEIQGNAILDMRLQRLTGLEVSKIKADLEELHKQIADYMDILANESRIWAIIKEELEQIANTYGEPRKTEISLDYGNIDIADLIPREDVVINLTHCGYVKRLPVAEYRAQHRAGLGVVGITTKDEDFVEKIFVTSSHDNLLFFTNYGKVYAIKGYEIPEASRQAKGRAIINLLQLQAGEKVTSLIPVNSTETGYLMMSTKNGLIKKTALSEFASIRKVGKIAIKLLEGDELISAELTTGNDSMIVSTHNGKCIHFSEKDVRAMGRDTQGVKCMDLANDDYLVSMIKISKNQKFEENEQKIDENMQKNAQNDTILLTITENGFGKRSSIDDYRLQSRAGKGVKAGELNDKTGLLVGIKQVTENDDIILISDKGTIIRVNSNEISKFSRDSMGVRVMKVADGEKVVSMAITPHNEDKVVDEQEEERTAEGLNIDNSITPEQIIENTIENENTDNE
jgi:DNA gyrase subunit A